MDQRNSANGFIGLFLVDAGRLLSPLWSLKIFKIPAPFGTKLAQDWHKRFFENHNVTRLFTASSSIRLSIET